MGGGSRFQQGEPIAIATLPPLGEVGFVDGPAAEGRGQHGADFGEGVEPRDEFTAWIAVAQAAVEVLAEFVGKAGDLSFAGDVHGLEGGGWLAAVSAAALVAGMGG